MTFLQRLRLGLPVAVMRHPQILQTRDGEPGRLIRVCHVPRALCLRPRVLCLARTCPVAAQHHQRGDDRAHPPDSPGLL